MSKFTMHRKTALQKMRPYVPGEDMTGISVAECDTPELGGWVAVSDEDRWYVAKAFYDKNYEEV